MLISPDLRILSRLMEPYVETYSLIGINGQIGL
jgi:hypothetical protein